MSILVPAPVRQALPFRLRGIDSGNGSEFINQHLWDYGQAQEIQFTRGRPPRSVTSQTAR